ncbi:MAG: ribose-phosphate diphosphokinase [Bdellovibrionales bacterium]
MPNKDYKIFGIGGTSAIARQVCGRLGIELSTLHEEKFPDGELKICPTENVEGINVFIFHSLVHDSMRTVNDRLCELCFLAGTLRDQGASQVTAVIPYLAYARADRRKEHLDPLNNRYVAQLLEAAGIQRVISLDVHNLSAFENAFRCPTIHVEANRLFLDYILEQVPKPTNPVVLSPDIGGIKRAERFRKLLESGLNASVDSGFFEKFRTARGATGHALVGDVRDRLVLIVDDMISTGGTILRAVDACKMAKAGQIMVFASHGLFTDNREKLLNSPDVIQFVVTDSNPGLAHLGPSKRLAVLPCASLFTDAVSRLVELE